MTKEIEEIMDEENECMVEHNVLFDYSINQLKTSAIDPISSKFLWIRSRIKIIIDPATETCTCYGIQQGIIGAHRTKLILPYEVYTPEVLDQIKDILLYSQAFEKVHLSADRRHLVAVGVTYNETL